jgi:hypothetical protein
MTEYVVERKNRRLTRRGRPAGWNRGSSVLEHEHVPGVSSNEDVRTGGSAGGGAAMASMACEGGSANGGAASMACGAAEATAAMTG